MLRSMKLKKSQMLQSRVMREVVAGRKTGTVEKWTFQLITPRGRLSLIALARRPVMKRREEKEKTEGYERARVASRDLSISRGRRNFLNYNALISLVFLSFPLSPVFLRQTRQLPSRSSCSRVICSTTRCGGNNYYAPNAVNLIYSLETCDIVVTYVRTTSMWHSCVLHLLSSRTNE